MDVTPITRQRRRRWALATPGLRSLTIATPDGEVTEHGRYKVTELLARHKGAVLYARGSLLPFRDVTDPREWQAETWRRRVIRITHTPTGTRFVSLRDALEDATDPVAELARFLAWLDDRGVAPSGLAGMALALWRTTLTKPLSIFASYEVGHRALFGSRQFAAMGARTEKGGAITSTPMRYEHMVTVDLIRAYPHAMGARPYATQLARVKPTVTIDPDVAGVAMADVLVDTDVDYPPLPVRIAPDAIQFQRGLVSGVWPWCELAAAIDLGFPVKVRDAYAPSQTADLFGAAWQEAAVEGASLGGQAQRLAKATLNSTWGTFGMGGDDRELIVWPDGDRDAPRHVRLDRRPLPFANTAHVAAETSARLRRRILLELLYARDVAPPVHVDTDGGIIRASSPSPEPSGTRPGEWRVKARHRLLEVKAPQVLRSQCERCGVTHPAHWHYTVSGVSPLLAPDLFARLPRGVRAGVRGLDIVLPDGHKGEPEAIRLEMNAAHVAQALMVSR